MSRFPRNANLKSFSFLWFALRHKVRGGGFRVWPNPEHPTTKLAVGEGIKTAQNAQNSSHSQCQMKFGQIGTSERDCAFSAPDCHYRYRSTLLNTTYGSPALASVFTKFLHSKRCCLVARKRNTGILHFWEIRKANVDSEVRS